MWPLYTTPTVAIWSTPPSPWWWPQSLTSLSSLLSKAAARYLSQTRFLCFIQSKSQNPSRALLDLGTLTFLMVSPIPCPPRLVSLLFLEHIKNKPCHIALALDPLSAWTLLSSSKLIPCFYIAFTSLFKYQLLNEATLTTLFKVPELAQSPGFPHSIIYCLLVIPCFTPVGCEFHDFCWCSFSSLSLEQYWHLGCTQWIFGEWMNGGLSRTKQQEKMNCQKEAMLG